MIIYSGGRGSGKTSTLVSMARVMNGYVIEPNKIAVNSVKADHNFNRVVSIYDIEGIDKKAPLFIDEINSCFLELLREKNVLNDVIAGTETPNLILDGGESEEVKLSIHGELKVESINGGWGYSRKFEIA